MAIVGAALSVLFSTQADAGRPGEGLLLLSGDDAQVSGPSAASFEENSEGNVASYTATGLESESVVWSLSGDDGAAFQIAGGVLSFAAVPDFEKPSDNDKDNIYEMRVTATDSSESASLDVSVTVTDVNDLNVIVIMADDAGYEVFGAYGSTQYSTPRLDAIASSGARVEQAFSKPLCTPSRVAIMTGKDSIRNYNAWIAMIRDEDTFGDLFGEAGYATAIAGKWQLHANAQHMYEQYATKPAGDGFDTYCLWDTALTRTERNSRFWNPWVDCDGELLETTSSDYGPDIFVDFLLDFIETNQRRPFFAYYPMVLPHSPYVLPPDSTCGEENTIQCRYEKMVTRVDHNVGLIYDKLDELGLLDNTLLVFTTDNGTPRQMVSRLGEEVLYGGKAMPTDGGTRVPLIAHVPGQTEGRVIADLVDITDIFPTVAEAAGIDLPSGQTFDGVSFWPQLQGETGRPREWIYTYYWPQPHKESHYQPVFHPEIAYARNKGYKLYTTGELFDVARDPLELYPLASDHADSADARAVLQGVLDSMPSRGENVLYLEGGFGMPVEGVPRPRLRPVLHSASITHNQLSLLYVGKVVTSPTPPVDSFTVKVDGAEVTVSSVEIELEGAYQSVVTLELESEVRAGQAVTVSYEPGSDPVRHTDRGRSSIVTSHGAAPLSDRTVANATPHNDPPTVTGPATVNHAEGGSGPVATFEAADAQGDELTWSMSGTDAGLFDIANGAVSFKAAPDFESPADGDRNNVYEVTLEVSDGRLTTTHTVSITVTNDDEPGQVTLSHSQPEVDAALTATLTDPDGVVSASWSWQRSQDRASWSEIPGASASTYTPSTADVEHRLRATADFEDGHGPGKRSHAVSESSTRRPPTDNTAPRFSSSPVNRSIPEDSAPGAAVGAPVTATDPDGDSLAYSLSGSGAGSFAVARLTGQITVGVGAALDHDTQSTYTVTVTATDPSGSTAQITVTITVTEANSSPISVVTTILNESLPPGDNDQGGSLPGGGEDASVEGAPETSDQFPDLSEAGNHQGPLFTLASVGVLTGTGCGEGRLCPREPIRRWEMAVWLVRVLGGADPDQGPASRFQDVDGGAWWAGHVERLAELGITVGCAHRPLRYCPDDPVTRGQMASFLVRAFDLPEAPPSGFTDTAGNVHAARIDALRAAGVTVGCSAEPFRYCPHQPTTRGQMASFLVRAMNTR